jgi:hypothetical protein
VLNEDVKSCHASPHIASTKIVDTPCLRVTPPMHEENSPVPRCPWAEQSAHDHSRYRAR